MKTRILLTVLVLCTAVVGCGDETPPIIINAQCDTNDDCTEECENAGYDKSICSTDGLCHCGDAPDQCIDAVDCECDEGEPDCVDGQCYCETTTVEPSCTENADCAGKCEAGCTATCVGDACVCTDCPDPDCSNITRGEMVSYIHGLLRPTGCIDHDATSTCTDFPDDSPLDCKWAELEELGVLTPMANCRPDDLVNRVEFIKILVDAVEGTECWPYPPEEPSFSDIDPGDWYYHAVEMAAEFRFITPGGEFRPGDAATTCFVEDVLYRTPTTSTIVVSVFPSEGSFTIRSGDGGDFEATFTGSRVMTGVPFGWYDVEFHDLPGYITPDLDAVSSLICYPTMAVRGIYLSADSPFNMRAVPIADSTVVKGTSGVPTMDVELEALEQGTVEKLSVWLNADTNNFSMSAAGNLAGNTVVASAMLYDGDDVVAGPEALVGVLDNGIPDQFDPDSGDYYKVVFTSLNYVVPAGTTKTLTLRVNLLNIMQETVYLRANILPCEQDGEVVVEDANGNAMIVNGETSNCHFLNGPIITVLTQGVLTAFTEGNPNGGILIAGSADNIVARYRFTALRESFEVTKLTIVNDMETNFGDETTATVAVAFVTITYTDINGVTQARSSSLSAGQTIFAGLDFYVPAGQDAYMEIRANINSMAAVGDMLSGMTFRLGVKDTGNTFSTFQAIGQDSSEAINNPTISNQSTVNSFVARKTRPWFSLPGNLTTTLINGENRLYGFTVAANNSGSVSFGRFPIWIDTTATLRNFKLFRGATDITSRVNIFSLTADISDGSENDFTGNVVMVSFNQEETVSSGASQTYYLDAEVLGAVTDDFIQTYLLGYDYDDLLALSNPCHNPNTGRIHDTDGSGIFDTEAGFSQAFTPMAMAVIWSDKSADIHSYPTVSGGWVTAGTGSCDWTNGWALGINQLTPHTLMYY